MSTLQQACPSCNRQLELPASALGRLAKCPACEAIFTVTVSAVVSGDQRRPQSAPTAAPPRSVPPTPPPSKALRDSPTNNPSNQFETPQSGFEALPENRRAGPASPDGTTSPVYQDANPFSSPLEEGMAAHLSANAYHDPPHYAEDAVAEAGTLKIIPRPIEEVFSTTFAIFGDRCGLLILAFLLFLVTAFVVLMAPILVLRTIAAAGGGGLAGIAFLVLLPLSILFSGYASVGLARNAIAVARNSPAPMSKLIPPIGIVVRFLVGAGVMTAFVAVVGIIIGGLMSLVSASGNNGLVTLATVIVFFAATVLSMVTYWLLWSWLFIVSDGRGTAFDSMQAAVALTMHNKTPSLLLVVISIVLAIVGTTLCYVGHLITTPLTMLLLAVAYLLMTNQQVSDPRLARQHYQNPPLGQSPF